VLMLAYGIAMLATHAITILSLLPGAYSHGFMVKPQSRNDKNCAASDYKCRSDVAVPRNYAGGFFNKAPGLGEGSVPGPVCGAGDSSAKFKKGEAVATYRAGDTIDVQWKSYANHGGHYAYRLCLDGSDTEECFKQNYLQNDKGETWIKIPPGSHKPTATFNDKIRIPQGINCDSCTLSWRWDTHSDQFDALTAGSPDAAAVRVNCADIVITGTSTPAGGNSDDVEGGSDVGGGKPDIGGNGTHTSSLLSAASPTAASSSFSLTVLVLSTIAVMAGVRS